ncbi:hypothetical protein ACTXK5_14295 [Arthrobacter rhombi]
MTFIPDDRHGGYPTTHVPEMFWPTPPEPDRKKNHLRAARLDS